MKWIVKPSNSCQGRGIFITSNFEEIPEKTELVVSQYIDNPLLLKGLKFDLRIYVAVTCFNPLRIYIYKEGLGRFATRQYDAEGDSKFKHLTNYSINKKSTTYQAEGENSSKKTL